MKLTLLVDLDDTLLANQMELFERVYLKALSKHLSSQIKPEIMLRELLVATQSMIRNNRADHTLEQIFDDAFYPAVGHSKKELQGIITQFYAEIFPTLKSVTSSKPDAARFIHWAIGQGHRLVVATNPLFPRTAIFQRLSWAGFPPEDFPFELISSYESFHFAKPNPAYYAEILAQLGWPQEPVVMVGNDLNDDIVPASKLGIGTFWVKDNETTYPDSSEPAIKSGNLDDLVTWLESEKEIPRLIFPENPDVYLAVLRANLAALLTISNSIKATDWNNPSNRNLYLSDLICHWQLIEKDVNLTWLELSLRNENPVLPDIDVNHQDGSLPPNYQRGITALPEFISARLQTLALLTNLSASDWGRSILHPVLGNCSLLDLVEYIVHIDNAIIRDCWQITTLS